MQKSNPIKISQRKNQGLPFRRTHQRKKQTKEATSLHPLRHLQNTVGNQAIGRIIQSKLKIRQPGDKFEQEADHVADNVMQMPEPQVQRQAEDEEEQIQMHPAEDEETLQTQENSDRTPVVTPKVQENINTIRGSGKPLPKSARTFFESCFGPGAGA